MKKEEHPELVVYTLEDWKKWLQKNHLTEKKVALINYKKHTGKPSISHQEAMHEAICFGWIDTTIKRLDDERFVRYFVRRGDKANWSTNTLRYGKTLLEAGRMASLGLQRYKEGLLKTPLDAGLSKKPSMPQELKQALTQDKQALSNFTAFAPSKKYGMYRWLLRAKQQETKDKRARQIATLAKQNKPLF